MRANKLFLFSLLLVYLLSTTSCITVITKVFFNQQGGGDYTFNFKFTQLDALGPAFKERLIEDMEKDTSANSRFDELGERLEGLEGISNIKTGFDVDELELYIKFDFDDINALNRGFGRVFTPDSLDTGLPYFEFDGKTMIRTGRAQFGDNSLTGLLSEDEERMEQMFQAYMRDSYYELILQFEKRIRKYDNKSYIKEDDHTLRWRQTMADTDKKQSVTIKLK